MIFPSRPTTGPISAAIKTGAQNQRWNRKRFGSVGKPPCAPAILPPVVFFLVREDVAIVLAVAYAKGRPGRWTDVGMPRPLVARMALPRTHGVGDQFAKRTGDRSKIDETDGKCCGRVRPEPWGTRESPRAPP